MKVIRCLFVMLSLAGLVFAGTAKAQQVVIKTNQGDIRLELDEEKAPLTVANFLSYVDQGFYNGTIFHRVIDGFMIQGGGFTADLNRKATLPPVKNEAANGLDNKRGTIAMARTQVVDSATSQFFINLKNNDFLNHRGKAPQSYGYAVFGRVVDGMDVVDAIGKSATMRRDMRFQDLPRRTVLIESIEKVEP